MALVDLGDMLAHARRHHYAIGAFDPVSVEFVDAIVAAAEAARAPLILSLPVAPVGFEAAVAAAVAAAGRATVPAALLANRCRSLDAAVRAINLGCNGVAVEPQSPSADDFATIRAMTDMAHACGVTVEAGVAAADGAQTGVDVLAVDADDQRPVANGAAAGIPLAARVSRAPGADECRRLIDTGVAEIHCGPALAAIAAERIAAAPAAAPGGYCELVNDVRGAIGAEAARLMQRFGSAGRAADVLQHARAGTPVEHLIIYNVQGVDAAQVEAMMARGREVLSRIPGVRRVFTGTAIPEQARYRFCWLVQFANARVIDSYRDHPAHVAFANEWFRPIAGDRISIDFAETVAGRPG